MGNLTSRNDVFTNIAQGNGMLFPFVCAGASGNSSSGIGSGFLSIGFNPNVTGTTLWSTIQGIPVGGAAKYRLIYNLLGGPNSSRGIYLATAYQIGTVNLTATGNQFTHDSATFPMTRTVLGVNNSPLSLVPILLITTSTSTTAPVFTINYTSQDGGSVTGTRTFTAPNVATVSGSAFVLRLENADSAIRDISAVNITTASSTGTAIIYGVELHDYGNYFNTNITSVSDSIFGGISLKNISPAATTSGTSTNVLALLFNNGGSSGTSAGAILAVVDS